MHIPSLVSLDYKTEGTVKCWFAVFPTEKPESRPQCLMSLDEKKQRHYNDQQNAERTRQAVISQHLPFIPYIHNTSQRTSWQHPATHNCAVETCFCWCFWLLWVLSEHGSFPESLTATEVSGKNGPAKGSLGRRGRYLHSGMTNVCRGRAEGTIWDSVYQPSQPENP